MTDKSDKVIIYTDGGCRGNPGPSAAGFVLQSSDGKHLVSRGFFLGTGTNNTAEYTALIKALENAGKIGAKHIEVFSDSELVVRQINGRYKVKSENIRNLYNRCIELLGSFERWSISHIPRDKNMQADELVNSALDRQSNITGTDICRAVNPQKITEPKRAAATHSPAPIRLGILISGGGTTMLNILENIKKGCLNAEITVVISSRSVVAGVERAKNAGLNVKIIRKKDYPDIDEFSNRIEAELAEANVDIVIQAGWLCLWKIPPSYRWRVMNIHPALLPGFGGKGMWGHHVHEAVLKTGCKVSGCTVHFCTNEYDKGPIILQRCCEVKDDDSADSLAERVFQQECIAYPYAIKLFEQGKLTVHNKVVKIKK